MIQDELLDQSINEGDITYSQLYKIYVNELYSYGVSLGFASNKCMDAIHDIYCRIFIDKKELHGVQNIKYYLFRCLKNRLLDIQKKDKRISHDNVSENNFSVEVSVMDTIIDEEERTMLKAKVQALMESLTSNQREAIYLRYMQEMEYEEIAQLLNINIDSARKLVYRGIEKLRGQSTLGILLIISLYFKHYNIIS